MASGKKVVFGSAVAAGLLTSALIAGFAFATPSVNATAQPKAAAATEAAEANESSAVDTDNVQEEVQDANDADDATEAAEAKGSAETDGINHEFDGEEIGDNGNGIPDANEAAETK